MKNYLFIILLAFEVMGCNSEKAILKDSQYSPATIDVKGEKAFVNGILGKTFYHRLTKTLKKNPQINTLILQEIPGSMDDEWNLKSCYLIYKKGITTELLENSVVESGGADLFVSGKKIIIAEGAKIGVHSWAGSEKAAIEYPKDHNEHKIFLDLYKSVEIDTSFYWYTLKAAPAEDIHYMTDDEIKKYLGDKIK
ncbi:hypothetical protein [Flammeovirga kamogawensis]|uniref:Lipoprotein n=1 Tax=Flammeovirga kamogawensis TaxID=373891 RepID=A0ABX8GUL7_9BACT|nr:hypothetical protein [Flammeovirga kamogawensis]MBB6459891.1 hypothetical protein [Flammeovirga kamogawensis]QWG07056.1 hypothetical protein KM029_17405 [Flammeovirga kamogawensis]TRX68877.1 hypothetical protein EO216_12395 [Flammeovirga kamogawensis]